MGLFNFLLGVIAGNAVSNIKHNKQSSTHQKYNSYYNGSCYDDIECNCDCDGYDYDSDNHSHNGCYDDYDCGYENYNCDCEAANGYGCCDDEYEERY